MSQSLQKTGPESEYQVLIQAGELKPDTDQAKAVAALERLHRELIDYPVIKNIHEGFHFRWPAGLFRWLNSRTSTPQGIYLYGGVGRGKSMLMDLFYTTATIASKRRVHFHEFMLDIHVRLKQWHDFSKQGAKESNQMK